jgi:hypothetical protein
MCVCRWWQWIVSALLVGCTNEAVDVHERISCVLCVLLCVDNNAVTNMLETHLQNIRDDPRYNTAVIYVYIEANMSFLTANKVKEIVEHPRFYPVLVQSFDPTTDARAGVWTGPDEKYLYAEEMKRALADGALVYAARFISSDESIKPEIVKQLEVYRREAKVSASGKRTIEYTGKSLGRKDDVCIVMQMLLHWSRLMRNSDEYQKAAELNGWRL